MAPGTHVEEFAMKNRIVVACSVALLGATAVAAQQTRPPAPTDALAMTVTGCLKSWDGKGNPASARAGSHFVLTDVDAGTSTPPGADRARARAKSGRMYLLSAGSSSVNFSQHLDHKVRVTGTRMPAQKAPMGQGTTDMAATADRPGASSSPPAAPGQERADQPGPDDLAEPAGTMPAISVTSVTMVAATCS
jgi:hypothetical protein